MRDVRLFIDGEFVEELPPGRHAFWAVGRRVEVAKVDRRDRKLAVVANRTRKNTKSFAKLMRFLDSLGIPIIAVLRDSQNFVHAAEQGMGLCEMPPSRVRADVDEIRKIKQWLDAWPERRRDTGNATSINQKPSLGRSLLRRAQFGSA